MDRSSLEVSSGGVVGRRGQRGVGKDFSCGVKATNIVLDGLFDPL